jgi:hypothetical protein
LRDEIYYGNDSAAHKLNGYWEVRRAIAALLERKRGTGTGDSWEEGSD